MFDLLSRPATEVAPLLLGAVVRVGEVAVRLTEVEAYMGEADPGSHAFRGPGKRNAVMYGPPGHLYTYFTYGMHTCANVVCMPEGVASGILLRAGEVIEGVDVAAERRATSKKPADLAMGPARLAVALGIRLDDAGTDLQTGRVRLELPESPSSFSAGPRTGVAGEGGTDEYPWRFWIPGEPSVSPYRAAVKRKRP
ncbi:DNA-3-methyladenine glycosylase [Salinibacterium amurskyense]|uniref:Putative 3-methyladenine DNA glycosylase n=1 Tax=Salinibacterium amurskyense TaxID=205941 RepID=A0A2M9D1Z6_9MICO|nr:DNA-3-methyladenine glycosylase [Salinibacterium amurskyense]PJJ78216.1 DNA-3-methyladenine glycosylase [Salinibacterium amurskyense]RLQ80356.1 DNA-3-methyladenine glycosylase [Salinibacterium amurskyense]GHD82750.1 putative 3-methyladenine DNA glycosylase [Salinibacterium amurskyense]